MSLTTTSPTTFLSLPGETAPLQFELGRGPITEDEALGVARRHARREITMGRLNSKTVVPDVLPAEDANRVSSIYRLPPRVVAVAKARAEMEGDTMTAVIERLLREYAAGTPTAPSAVAGSRAVLV